MFGYVRPFKPDLRMAEFETYKAVYCGLCGQMGKAFGPVARLALSYDFAFLAILYFAACGEQPVFERRGCYVNPLRKLPVATAGEGLAFSADTALIMLYYKVIDNLQDSRFAKRMLWGAGLPLAGLARRKAAARMPACDAAVALAMGKQRELEQNLTASLDAACEPTALAMQAICGQISGEADKKRILERVGYLLGRYVYLCDALDDLPRDLKSGLYNPFIYRHKLKKDAGGADLQGVFEQGRRALYLTAGEAGKAYSLLDPAHFGPILDNVFYQGLRAGVDEIFAKRLPKSPDQFDGQRGDVCLGYGDGQVTDDGRPAENCGLPPTGAAPKGEARE